MENKKWISGLSSVTFNGKEYTTREINVKTFGQRTIAGESLQDVLMNEFGVCVSADAKRIDEGIFFYVEDKYLSCGDQQLAAKVEKEIGIEKNPTPKEKFKAQASDFRERRLMEAAMTMNNIYNRMVNEGKLHDCGIRADVYEVLCNLARDFEETFFETDEYEDDYVAVIEKWLPDKLIEEFDS